MKYSGIYAITDENLLPDSLLLEAVEQALSSGVSMLQFRKKSGSEADKLNQARRLLSLCRNYNVPLIINDDVDLCLEVGAEGVHLGQQDNDLVAARQRLGTDSIIGVTCHDSLELAQVAEESGADYVAFGRFFPSSTKPAAPPADMEILKLAKQTLGIPVVAIGGINAENGAALISAGADMLAVIHSVFGSMDIANNTRSLVELFETRQGRGN